MKRFISMVLAALMALSMFTACGGGTTESTAEGSNNSNGAPIEITYCYWGGAVDAKARGEIADLLQQKEATVRTRLRRGREQLKAVLKEAYDFGEGV